MNSFIRLFAVLLFALPFPAIAQDGIWLLIDTKKMLLDVKLGKVTLVRFDNISIGRNGSGFKHQRGDEITPLGRYKISWIDRKSQYNLFYGFNYPSRKNIETALKKKLVDIKTFNSVMIAHKNNRVPPQNTPVGGLIGIHGLGRADKKIHATMNWTRGCIALTNEQIEKLDTWVQKGTIVVVK